MYVLKSALCNPLHYITSCWLLVCSLSCVLAWHVFTRCCFIRWLVHVHCGPVVWTWGSVCELSNNASPPGVVGKHATQHVRVFGDVPVALCMLKSWHTPTAQLMWPRAYRRVVAFTRLVVRRLSLASDGNSALSAPLCRPRAWLNTFWT